MVVGQVMQLQVVMAETDSRRICYQLTAVRDFTPAAERNHRCCDA